MSVDTELDVWRSDWQSAAAVPGDLRSKVERQSRWMKLGVAADTLVTIVIGGGAAVWAVRSPQPDIVLLAAVTWVFIAVAWAFGIVVNRGNWAPAALDTEAFLDLAVRRCRARLASTWFGAGLAVCELVFSLGWVYQHSSSGGPLWRWLLFSSIPIDLVWMFMLLFFGFLIGYRRIKLAELAWLLELRKVPASNT